MTEQTYDVSVVREFDAPIERVWAAWTQPDDLREVFRRVERLLDQYAERDADARAAVA